MGERRDCEAEGRWVMCNLRRLRVSVGHQWLVHAGCHGCDVNFVSVAMKIMSILCTLEQKYYYNDPIPVLQLTEVPYGGTNCVKS